MPDTIGLSSSCETGETPITVRYKFLLQRLGNEGYTPTSIFDEIIITGPLLGATEQNQDTDSLASTMDIDDTPESPKTRAISSAQANGCIPCTAKYRWGDQHATFYCLYDSSQDRFCHFTLGPEEAMLGNWEAEDIEISHAPFAFHGIWGTPVYDDNERRMLFVKMDAGSGYTIRLYGKRVEQGEREPKFSKAEREHLGLD